MTSIQAWAGVDPHGVASLYIASDSRISWGSTHHWDRGRKVFAADRMPHVFGYWGDVLFPALALPQIIDQIDYGIAGAATENEWRAVVERRIRMLWQGYPIEEKRTFGVLHGYRIGEGVGSRFGLTIVEYRRQAETWNSRSVPMPPGSAILHIAGSGAASVGKAQDMWALSSSAGTSRAAYSALVESIMGGADPTSGGPPQLCGLYRIGSGLVFGTVVQKKRYFAGADVDAPADTTGVQWRNELFEIADGETKRRKRGAQPHMPR